VFSPHREGSLDDGHRREIPELVDAALV